MAPALCEGRPYGADPTVADTELRSAPTVAAIALTVGGCHLGRAVGEGSCGLPARGGTPAAALRTGTPILVIGLEGAEA